MLGIDHQDDGWEEVEPGGDPGVGGGIEPLEFARHLLEHIGVAAIIGALLGGKKGALIGGAAGFLQTPTARFEVSQAT